jgi:hypothetical protein
MRHESTPDFKARIAALMRGDEREDSFLYVARNRAHPCVVRKAGDAPTPSEVMFAERSKRRNQTKKTEMSRLVNTGKKTNGKTATK